MKYLVTLNGKDYEVEVERGEAILIDVRDTPAPAAAAPVAAAPVAAAPAAAPAVAPAVPANGTPVTAPMPGTILSVKVSAGQAVKAGDIICTLEAMKMENEIFAGKDGTVVSVSTSVGAAVVSGDVLAVIG